MVMFSSFRKRLALFFGPRNVHKQPVGFDPQTLHLSSQEIANFLNKNSLPHFRVSHGYTCPTCREVLASLMLERMSQREILLPDQQPKKATAGYQPSSKLPKVRSKSPYALRQKNKTRRNICRHFKGHPLNSPQGLDRLLRNFTRLSKVLADAAD